VRRRDLIDETDLMAKKTKAHLLNLPTQGVILIIVIISLTTCTIGIPAIWLIRGQLDRQAWELVNQGNQTVKALMDARYNELSNLAILTAQRPTLSTLLELDDSERLNPYLDTLRLGANLDMVMICDRHGEPVAQAGFEIPAQTCITLLSKNIYPSPSGSDIPGWLLAYHPVMGKSTDIVVVGQALSNNFSSKLSEQIGLELLLLYNGELIGGSFPDNDQTWEAIASQPAREISPVYDTSTDKVTIDGASNFIIRSSYGETGLDTIVLLPGTAIAAAQQRLTRNVAGGILIVTIFCSIMAILLAKRVSAPLGRLRDSAIALRKGDLVSPVITNTKVREIAEVSYALEDARIALRHSLEELNQEKDWGDYLLESVVEGIVTVDRQGRITFFSHGAERITGYGQEQVLGKAIDEVFLLTDREIPFSQRIPLPGTKPEIVIILVNERPQTIAISGARLAPPEAGKANLAISIRDISNEEAMRGLLGDFLGNITHEFRTPLTALAVSIELLLDQLPELNLAEIRELLVSNHLGVLSLQNLIDNLLEGASIEAGRFQVSPRPTDLAEVIHEVARVMQPLMEKNHQYLQIEVPVDMPLVQADARRTCQVLVNILSNAIKWGPQGSTIFLSAVPTTDDVKVFVADQGPGITPEDKKNLFTRFGQGKSGDGRTEYGAGLGLSVVKAIVESQKGQVGVEDRQGSGVIFWFTIPTVALSSSKQEEDL